MLMSWLTVTLLPRNLTSAYPPTREYGLLAFGRKTNEWAIRNLLMSGGTAKLASFLVHQLQLWSPQTLVLLHALFTDAGVGDGGLLALVAGPMS